MNKSYRLDTIALIVSILSLVATIWIAIYIHSQEVEEKNQNALENLNATIDSLKLELSLDLEGINFLSDGKSIVESTLGFYEFPLENIAKFSADERISNYTIKIRSLAIYTSLTNQNSAIRLLNSGDFLRFLELNLIKSRSSYYESIEKNNQYLKDQIWKLLDDLNSYQQCINSQKYTYQC